MRAARSARELEAAMFATCVAVTVALFSEAIELLS
jgi:hypothetical protein